jgi:hypothetical protein
MMKMFALIIYVMRPWDAIIPISLVMITVCVPTTLVILMMDVLSPQLTVTIKTNALLILVKLKLVVSIPL